MNTEFSSLLASHNLRVTRPRRAIFDTLTSAQAPLSITDVIRQCPTIDKVSVYRTIETFTRVGITTTVAHGWKQRYELAAPLRPHHHHLRCTQCSSVIDIHSDELEQLITRTAVQHSFTPLGHTFEISGLCDVCSIRQAG